MKKVKLFEQFIAEATTSWSKMMKGVRAGNGGPWSIVAIQDRKTVGQSIDIKIQDLIPAKYEALKAEFPKAKLHIEDGGGEVVWNESFTNEANVNLNASHLSSSEYQKAKKLKGFDAADWKWNGDTELYDKIDESLNEALAAADKSKLTNKVEITVAIARTLMNNARNRKLKHMSAPGGVTHYWNPKTNEYVGRTEQEGRLNQGTYFFSDALDKEGNLTESYVNEAVDATREDLMDLMETKYKIKSVRNSEDFDGQTEGIWIAADNDETLSGSKIFDYYNKSAKYKNGVLKTVVDAVEKKGWWFSWNDPGTIMIWPKN